MNGFYLCNSMLPFHPGRDMAGRGNELRVQMQQTFPEIRVANPGIQTTPSPQVISIITSGVRPVLNKTSLQGLMSAQVTQKSTSEAVTQPRYTYSATFYTYKVFSLVLSLFLFICHFWPGLD